ncbi:MAG: HDIG domain-containing protein [Deltaproteobacteria bacterium]|nr:HDIG domain-containing protein [Deltaproteobacteria bacterium]
MAIKKPPQNGTANGDAGIRLINRILSEVFSRKSGIAICVGLILTLILSPQILRIAPPEYKVGAIITKDIQADRDFLVIDRAATEQKRAVAVESTRDIYDYDSNMPAKIGIALSKAFLATGEYIKGDIGTSDTKKTSAGEAKNQFEDISEIPLTDGEFKMLAGRGFPIDLCNNIVRLVYYTYGTGLIGNRDVLDLHRDKGITIREIRNQEEKDLNDLSSIRDTGKMRGLIRKNAAALFENKKPDGIILSLTQKAVRPNLTFAKNATEKRKQTVSDEVKPVLYEVQKNEMIIREGEKTTPADLDKLDAFYKGKEGSRFINASVFSGIFLTIVLLSVIFYRMSSSRFRSSRTVLTDILFMGIVIILQVVLVKVGIFICDSVGLTYKLIPASVCIYAIPFTIGTMLVAILIGRNEGLIFSVFSSLMAAFLFEDKTSIFMLSLVGSVVAAHYIIRCERRSAFLKIGLVVGVVNMGAILCLSLLSGSLFTIETLIRLVMGILGGVLSGFIVSGLVPLFESLFGYTTDIKLLELANLNQPIFQELLMMAPGTYHHSVIVASLVEAAAEEIGANAMLAKVSAYYHDVGKMKKPLYFIENQPNWKNRHDDISPQMSSLVIISHVKDGCELAREHNLGKAITDIIQQHHGTGLVSYFHEKAKKECKTSGQSILEGDFRYPGPKPQKKEAGLVLLGDVIEASSRTLSNPTPARIKNLVNSRIQQVVEKGQLDESDLTFRDLRKIGEIFTRILTGIFHRRIEYQQPSPK